MALRETLAAKGEVAEAGGQSAAKTGQRLESRGTG